MLISASQESNWKRLVPNQPFSPFIFCCVYVPANTTSILYFKSSVHTQSLLVFTVSHTPLGSIQRRTRNHQNLIVSVLLILLTVNPSRDLNTHIHTHTKKTSGLLQKIIQEFLGFLHFCVQKQHVENHHPCNSNECWYSLFFLKDDISRVHGDSRQVFAFHWVPVQGWIVRLPYWKPKAIELCFRVI